MSTVDLGFAEKCEPWQVESYQFPSKVGGKPAWLNLENLPTIDELKCKNCNEVLQFLCQVYAPIENDDNHFHRTLYVFICRDVDCCKRNNNNNLKVFRNSLKRYNRFYSYNPPEEKENDQFENKWSKLCHLCGCLAEIQCTKCENTFYCCREHQALDWKQGHNNECDNNVNLAINNSREPFLFPQYQVFIEIEELNNTSQVNEEDELKKFAELEKDGKVGTMSHITEDELDSHAKNVEKDKIFFKFRKRIELNPDQILRYEKGGTPLWIANGPMPPVTNCDKCGAPREFEFQLMPQLLTRLNDTDLDWGILAVYSCSKNCPVFDEYLEEFIFKQDVEEISEF